MHVALILSKSGVVVPHWAFKLIRTTKTPPIGIEATPVLVFKFDLLPHAASIIGLLNDKLPVS